MRTKIPIKIIELEHSNFHLLVSSNFYDETEGMWVIDTGASKSVFDQNLEKYVARVEERTEDLHSAGIGAEPMKSSLCTLKDISFGKLKVTAMGAALLDLNHINELYANATDVQICGLLGGDFLMKYRAVVDYKRELLILRS
ncbi:aspartyl protease family protein [Maribellus sp. YY47]|uniref:aspartyl protease family protein n=1 Tax=Maribellus sp. YY47 TaxID=2929486 RepID=UPI00200112C7|nr:aspartyl protease family protein [Maribellus sp. YY47]MCK3683829.1 aspartyl protease family protein [Maribellus sp. YY47]